MAEIATPPVAGAPSRATRVALWVPGLLVAAGAIAATAHGLYEVAIAAQVPPAIAWLYPVITDGLGLVAYAAAARLRGSARRYSWAVVTVAAGLSGLAQAAYLAGDAAVAAPAALRFGVGAWPAVAAAIVAHLLHLLATAPGPPHAPDVDASKANTPSDRPSRSGRTPDVRPDATSFTVLPANEAGRSHGSPRRSSTRTGSPAPEPNGRLVLQSPGVHQLPQRREQGIIAAEVGEQAVERCPLVLLEHRFAQSPPEAHPDHRLSSTGRRPQQRARQHDGPELQEHRRGWESTRPRPRPRAPATPAPARLGRVTPLRTSLLYPPLAAPVVAGT
jgi:hypothetical protein